MEFPQRNGGFFDILYDETYYFDCSSFVTTILNRVFDFPPPEPKGENGEVVVWATIHYFENINKENSIFNVVQRINKEGEKLDLEKLEIGDIILGRAKKYLEELIIYYFMWVKDIMFIVLEEIYWVKRKINLEKELLRKNWRRIIIQKLKDRKILKKVI